MPLIYRWGRKVLQLGMLPRAAWEWGGGRRWGRRQETQGHQRVGPRTPWEWKAPGTWGREEKGMRTSRNEEGYSEFWRGEGAPIGFGESGLTAKKQPGPRMGEGGESQDIEPF